MRRLVIAVVAALALGMAPAPASADQSARTLVFQLRFTGLVATASWTTCPQPVIGDVCMDTDVLAFDSAGREGKVRDRGPTLRTLTFVYRVVGGEFGTVPVAEWFGRTEVAAVSGAPRLGRATAEGVVPVVLCSVFDPTAGFTCPDEVAVDLTWTGIGSLTRIAEHDVARNEFRMENTWTRGWQRTATVRGSVGGSDLGTPAAAELLRVRQGEVVVQHPVP
jgi:hypothetical protein